jgi:hypothetical protein
MRGPDVLIPPGSNGVGPLIVSKEKEDVRLARGTYFLSLSGTACPAQKRHRSIRNEKGGSQLHPESISRGRYDVRYSPSSCCPASLIMVT